LVERRRNIAAFLPVPALAPVAGAFRRWVGSHPAISASSAGAVVVGGAVAAAALVGGGGEPAAAPRPTTTPTTVASTPAPSPPTVPPTVVVDGQPLGSPGVDPDLGNEQGARVTVDRAVVLDVPADEGFWIDGGGGRRLWVQLLIGAESPLQVEAGQRVSFAGSLVAHGPGYAATQGVAPEGAAELDGAGAHVEVRVPDLRVEPR
jgi:hypothetical protein